MVLERYYERPYTVRNEIISLDSGDHRQDKANPGSLKQEYPSIITMKVERNVR